MVTKGLLITFEARPGREADVEQFLMDARPTAEGEPGTTAWFAIRMGQRMYGIFDVFPDDEARRDHLNGQVARTLMERATELLDAAPTIMQLDVLASKLPVETRSAVASGG